MGRGPQGCGGHSSRAGKALRKRGAPGAGNTRRGQRRREARTGDREKRAGAQLTAVELLALWVDVLHVEDVLEEDPGHGSGSAPAPGAAPVRRALMTQSHRHGGAEAASRQAGPPPRQDRRERAPSPCPCPTAHGRQGALRGRGWTRAPRPRPRHGAGTAAPPRGGHRESREGFGVSRAGSGTSREGSEMYRAGSEMYREGSEMSRGALAAHVPRSLRGQRGFTRAPRSQLCDELSGLSQRWSRGCSPHRLLPPRPPAVAGRGV